MSVGLKQWREDGMHGEFRREAVELERGSRVEILCPECGLPVELWFNGGELDATACCGAVFCLEARGYDLVGRSRKAHIKEYGWAPEEEHAV